MDYLVSVCDEFGPNFLIFQSSTFPISRIEAGTSSSFHYYMNFVSFAALGFLLAVAMMSRQLSPRYAWKSWQIIVLNARSRKLFNSVFVEDFLNPDLDR